MLNKARRHARADIIRRVALFAVALTLSIGAVVAQGNLCEDGPFPQCGGDCPVGAHCEAAALTNPVLPSPQLPPESDPSECDQIVSQYVGIDLHALFPGGIDFANPRHKCFRNVQRTTDPGTGDEFETFDSTVEGTVDDGSGAQPVTLTGPVTVVVRGKGGATTGSWDTEILSMSLTGDVGGIPIEMRESPSLPSPGHTTVNGIGGGQFQIDSFFDVFTELSIDGGPFMPQMNQAGRVRLTRVRPATVLPTPDLPPDPDPLKCDRIVSLYEGQGVHAVFPNGVDFSDPKHECFQNVQRTTDPGTGDETEMFDSIVRGLVDDGNGPQPVVLSGPVTVVVRGKGGATTGSWDTEILSMSLSGDHAGLPIEIRESPGLPSLGRTTVSPDGAGQFIIDSFFDVFTELSIAGGPFQPQQGPPGRVHLVPLNAQQCECVDDPISCEQSSPAVCDGPCPNLGDVCTPDLVGGPCFCQPQQVPCEQSDPATCGGFCQNSGDICTPDPFGGPCFCEPAQIACEQSEPGTCGGVCPNPGDVCTDGPVGCFCEPPPVFCEDTSPDVCDGLCPNPNDACTPQTSPILPSPDLPPEAQVPGAPRCDQLISQYEGQDLHALFPGGIDFSDPKHSCFENVILQDDGSGNEIETFDSQVEAQVDLGSGPVPVTVSGPVSIVTYGKIGNTTGTFQTEMISMSLSGDVGGVPVEVRESPSLPSAGQTTITDVGGGQFRIDSFFDVYTEISVNGAPFEPQTNGPGRVRLVPINPGPCECLPAACDLSDPLTCDGPCPNANEICTPDPAGGPCFCEAPPTVCELSDPATCGGVCPIAGEVCTTGPVGCFCEPPPVFCEDTSPDVCDGLCPNPNDACTPQTSPILPSPDLPPEAQVPGAPRCDQLISQYEGQDLHALFPGGIDFSDPKHSCFENVILQDDGSGNEIETFDSQVEAQVDLGSGPVPVTVSGPVSIVTYGKIGNTTGTFQTEMISMSLSGDVGGVPVEVRESPSLPSAGQTTITDVGGGQFRIDSFFDVYTEISVNGAPFEPQTNGPGRVRLVPINPGPCECLPAACDLSDPLTCDGPCPNANEICTPDPAGGPCFCEAPPTVCELSDPATCGGVCPIAGEVCTTGPVGCFCEPPPVFCEDTSPDVCDGLCPNPNDACTPQTSPILPSPDLPPEAQVPGAPRCDQLISQYEGQDLHALFPGGIDFSDPKHSCFENVILQDDGSGNEIETFDSQVEAQVDLGSGPVPVTVSGPVSIVTYGKIGNTTGTFQTEMISMSLSGDVGGVPVEVRESPSLPSAGQTTITDVGGGQFRIDSFFDVYTEISVNGAPFEPQTNGPGRVQLVPINPGPCECLPAACDLSDPLTCDGPCPNANEICTPDPAGGPCFCEAPPTVCELSDPATCGGVCPIAGEVCTTGPVGCFCEPPPVFCEDTSPDVCDGLCPNPNDACTPQTSPILPSPDLPPEAQVPGAPRCDQLISQYEGQDLHALFPGGIDFSDPKHSCFENVILQDDGSGNEIETFDSQVEAQVDLGSGPVPVTVSGPVSIVTYGKIGNTTGTFQTEMISMSLSGDVGGVPVEVRESPSLPSAGQTTITDVGGGQFRIDSFFDVYTEISVNGAPFEPQTNGPGRVRLVPINPGPCECLPAACDLSDPLTCDGPCPVAGDICTPNPVGGPCTCETPPTVCELSDPGTCGGVCPTAGDVCTPDPAGGDCRCVTPPVPCEDSANTCDGFCPAQQYCSSDATGVDCFCVPLEPPFCGDSAFPECDGSCPPDERCADTPIGCDCRTCDTVDPGVVTGVSWDTKDHVSWDPLSCATTYNLYVLTARRMDDLDGDGSADDYGVCSQPGLLLPEAFHSSSPPSGFVDFVSMTGDNAVGEGSLGSTSSGARRVNATPCP